VILRTPLVVLLFMVGVTSGFAHYAPYYPNITATSPNGRLLLEAKTPDRLSTYRSRTSSQDFVYTLTDTETERVLWTRKQQEAMPTGAWVHDDGWIVIRTADNDIVAIDTLVGRKTVRLSVTDEFKKDRASDRFVPKTRASTKWSTGSIWYFIEHDTQVLFVVRPWWGRRVLLDLTVGRVADPDDPELASACDEYEADWALESLRSQADRVRDGQGLDQNGINLILEATNIVSAQRLDAALPDLRILEWWCDPKLTDVEFLPEDPLRLREVNIRWGSEFETRQRVQHAIRRAGGTPSPAPATYFRYLESGEKREPILPTESSEKQLPTPDPFNSDSCGHSVIQLFGPPDFMNRNETWEYDVDTNPPYTVRIQFKNGKFLHAERLTTPAWTDRLGRLERLNQR